MNHETMWSDTVSTRLADPVRCAIEPPATISLIVTTYGTDSYYTQACLESIRRWKNDHHELIVVVHDESALLRAYLEACNAEGLIDRLIAAAPGHGHTRSFNLGVSYARGDVVFNICNDICIGPSIVDDCAHKLRHQPQLGMIGWHWYNEGTFWSGETIREYKLRDESNPLLSPHDQETLRRAQWHTGRAFRALGGPKWLCLCNTGFFGARKEVIDRVGGGFGPQYHHYFADDALNYAVLDLGLNIENFEAKFRHPSFFHEFQHANTDAADRRRHDDFITCRQPFLDSIRLLGGGVTETESIFLHLLAKAVPTGATVTNVGVWRGSSAIVLMDALAKKDIKFKFIDCFDLPDISSMSAQPPVSQGEFLKYIQPYISRRHDIEIIQANTLELSEFPRSDFVFLDAGHTKECVAHDAPLIADCLNPGGVAAFHDYGQPSWPDVKPELDHVFPDLECFGTVAVYRRSKAERSRYDWPSPATS